MILSEPLVSLMTLFRTSLIKFYHSSQRMSDSFYHITESSELNLKKGFISYTFRHVGQPCFRIFTKKYIGTVLWPMTSWNLISHVCDTRKFVMTILYWQHGLLCDKRKFLITTITLILPFLTMHLLCRQCGARPDCRYAHVCALGSLLLYYEIHETQCQLTNWNPVV